MKIFTYNDMYFSIEPAGRCWDIVCKRGDSKTAYVAAGVFADVPEAEVEARAKKLVKAIVPVGVRLVGPDVAHPTMIGGMKIVGPDVGHPNFIYWDKESASCPKQI